MIAVNRPSIMTLKNKRNKWLFFLSAYNTQRMILVEVGMCFLLLPEKCNNDKTNIIVKDKMDNYNSVIFAVLYICLNYETYRTLSFTKY